MPLSPGLLTGGIIGKVTVENLSVVGDAERVYLRYSVELTRFATGLVGPWDAQDAVVEALIRCVQNPGWLLVSDPRAYLYRAVLNECRQVARSRSRRTARERLAAPPLLTEEEGEVRPEIWAAVSRLSVRQRAVVVLAYWEDLAPSQIAERLGIGEGSVRRHLARARKELRKVLRID